MSACSDDGDNGTTANTETGYVSSTCQDGDILPTEFDGKYFFCSDNRWLLHNQESEDFLQQGASSQSTADISTCQNGTTFTDGLSNYVCTGNQWVLVEPSISSSQNLLITSSSSFKAKSSSSTKKISSSSVIAKSSSSKAECDGGTRLIWLQKAYTTDTSEYKIVKRDLWADACVNGKWGFPSNICDSAVAGKPVPSENKVINGIRYHIWCYDRLYFDLACDKEGDRDTIIDKNGEIKARLCYKNGGWSEIISESSSSSPTNQTPDQESSSSFSYTKCFNPNINYGKMTDTRDGHVYKTVVIGNQTWMAENLNYQSSHESSYQINYEPKLLSYQSNMANCSDREPKNCDITGRSYSRIVAFDSIEYSSFFINVPDSPCKPTKGLNLNTNTEYTVYRTFDECYDQLTALLINEKGHFRGICPIGWHIPTVDEYIELLRYINAFNTNIADNVDLTGLKSTCGWNGTDDFGFSLIPTKYENTFSNAANRWLEFYSTTLWYIHTRYIESGHADLLHTKDITTTKIYANYNANLFVRADAYLSGMAYVRCVKD